VSTSFPSEIQEKLTLKSKENFTKKKNAPKDEKWIEIDDFSELKESGVINVGDTQIKFFIFNPDHENQIGIISEEAILTIFDIENVKQIGSLKLDAEISFA